MPSPALRGAFGAQTAVASWTPARLSGLLAWYDASDTGSITSSGGLVSQWNDLSGNGYHLVQGTEANQPTTGSRTVNGLNALDFGVADFMTSSPDPANTVQPISMYYGIQLDSTSGNKYQLESSFFDSCKLQLRDFNTNYYANAGTSWNPHSGVDTNLHMWGVVFNGASSVSSLDGTEVTGNPGTNSYPGHDGNGIQVGAGSEGFDGSIVEIVIAAAALDAPARAVLLNYYQTKWGTP